MSNVKSKPAKGAYSAAIRAFLMEHPDGNRPAFHAAHPEFAHFAKRSARFYVVRQAMRKANPVWFTEGAGPKPSASPKVERSPKRTALQDAAALLDENQYLRWLLEGERQGWLDRALNELASWRRPAKPACAG